MIKISTDFQLNFYEANALRLQIKSNLNYLHISTDKQELLGWKCDKFVYEEIIDRNKQKYTMWVRYVDMLENHFTRQAIPVRFEVQGWDNLIGAHYDHYHLDYNYYSNNEISDDIFEVNEGDFH